MTFFFVEQFQQELITCPTLWFYFNTMSMKYKGCDTEKDISLIHTRILSGAMKFCYKKCQYNVRSPSIFLV